MPSPFDDIFGSRGPQWTTDQIKARIRSEATAQGVDPDLALAVATQESYLNPGSVGDNGKSIGLFQLQPAAAQDVGIPPQWRDDPGLNIYGGVRYLKLKLAQSKGNVDEALSRYNRGTPDYRGIGDPEYVQNVKRFLPQTQPATREQPGMMARVASVFSPASAEAATPQQAAPSAVWDDIFGAQQAPAVPEAPAPRPAPPTSASTPAQDAAYRDWAAQQAPGGTQGAARPQTPAAPSVAPAGRPPATSPDPTATPGMRFQALPSITQLPPEERVQRTREFAALRPDLQEEFLRSEEPSAASLAVGGGPTRQATPVTDPLALLAVGGKPPVPPAPQSPADPITPDQLDAAISRELAPAEKYAPLVFGGAAAGSLGRMGGTMLSQQLGRLSTALPIVGEGLANLGFRKATVAAGMEEPGTAGDVAAVAGPAVLGAAAPVVAKVGNALRGVVKPAYQSIVDTAERYGIRLSYGDVTRGSAVPKVETVLEAIPGSGAGRMRVGQQADVTRAGAALKTGLETEMRTTPWRDLASVQQAARGTGPRAKEAQVLLAEIDDAGDDWGRVVQTSGKLNLFQDRVRAETLYNKVEELAQPLGNMRLPKATQAIDDAIARANDDVLPSPEVKREVIGALNRLKGEISPTESVRPSMGVRDPVTGTLRAEPVTPTTNVPDTTYSRMRRLRSSLGDLQREAAEPATARYLSGVKSALEEDMAAFTTQSNVPQLARAAKDADTFFRTRIVPYREGQLARAIEKNLPDEIYNQFVRRGKDRAQYFYNGLDPKGQAAVRYGMVEEAMEKAQSGAPDVFSPARFASALMKIQDAHGVFFKGTPQWEINGITKVMQHAQRAGQYAENPPTGQRGIAFGLLGGGAFASLPTVAQVLGTAQGLRTLLMTQRGRTFLLAASDMQPGSAAFQRRLDIYLRQLPAVAEGVGAGMRAREETPAR